ncbi:hypoxanthine phosphoribosyltransferase [Candidatus Collierbacteria bacterium RIFOXYD1_FULL_40_9]|uniref:Hypoxanthine phosphoribosyltransferase n=1 Tax=Candidatus Collierbacteria bacterium RIFOXYD1_FULL_40_9 TaxID=1817731 RepID=A0A1F5FVE4_9BACT|nr:MAG: hypoxanthine phosphoribosyltransferase [Candidatus Collierbacteria bacterium RIFOXYD1_FULL_40_9]
MPARVYTNYVTENSSKPAWEELLSEEIIKSRVVELAKEIAVQFPVDNLLVVCVLRGGFIFTADLVRELYEYFPDLEIDFVAVSSYGGSYESSRSPRIDKDLNIDITNRNVLLVEDIVDTGYSFAKLLDLLATRNPKSLKTCAFLSKPDRREIEVPIDFVGFSVPDKWLEGFGLDSAEKGRHRKNIVAKV